MTGPQITQENSLYGKIKRYGGLVERKYNGRCLHYLGTEIYIPCEGCLTLIPGLEELGVKIFPERRDFGGIRVIRNKSFEEIMKIVGCDICEEYNLLNKLD